MRWDTPRASGPGMGGPQEPVGHQAPRCFACGGSVSAGGLTFGSKTYHSNCFQCSACHQSIRGSFQPGEQGEALCEGCARARAPRCAGCSLAITGKYVSAENQTFHKECFVCASCRRPLSGQHSRDGDNLSCQACYERAHPPERCAKCGSAVRGRAMRTGGQTFHAECFTCCSCRREIDGPHFRTDDGPGYLCVGCQPRCSMCNETLGGKSFVRVDGATLHKDCFRCCDCGDCIDGGFFEVPKTNPFQNRKERHRCGACHTRSLQQREDVVEARAVAAEDWKKQSDAAKYKLAWRPEIMPCPNQALRDLGVVDVSAHASKGELVCITFDEASGRVGCAPVSAAHAEAAVSLPYLACVLRVLRESRREPQFSLDPKDPHDLSGPFLLKRFYPEWLGGTVVGEVLFQADYALKQLCFGDLRLPGIPSVFDGESSGGRSPRSEPAAARQWFTMRRVGITVTADGALVPHVELGVEARRLTHGPTGYIDAPFTDPNDPTARQAAAVTARFPEVVAQLPVAAQLMQLARATVLAVYLLGRGCKLNDSLLDRYRIPGVPEGSEYSIQIPTLVKDRNQSIVGSKAGDAKGLEINVHRHSRSMRGGVDLAVPGDRKVPTRAVTARLLDPRMRPVPLPLFLPAPSHSAAARAA
mmetsp:Transcript_160925/g.516478  ORF Transcript_160925/g.516478 Transcript_160925/m.516478 type:complete len:644 (-) Transcript_160925:143-2074(-)